MKSGECLVEVPHHRGAPPGEVLRGSVPAKVRERLQCGAVATGKLDEPRQDPSGHGARTRSGWGLSCRHARTKLVAQLSPLSLGVLRCIPLLLACVATASDPRHRLDRGEHGVGFDIAVRMRARVIEQHPKPREPVDLGIDTSR